MAKTSGPIVPRQPNLNTLEGLEWLVAARNEIQVLMFNLYRRWQRLDSEKREYAAGAAFSLWRAAFLLAEKELKSEFRDESGNSVKTGRVQAAAKSFLHQVVRTNAINFPDDMRNAPWTAGYYINNAVYRVNDMRGQPGSHTGSSVRTLRQGWNDSFAYLEAFVSGGTD